MKIILISCLALYANILFGQNTFNAVIRDSETKTPLLGATAHLVGTNKGAIADKNGQVTLTNIPNGKQLMAFYCVGYEAKNDTFEFPLSSTEPIEIFLKIEVEELESVVISSTRSSRTIRNIPTRVEYLDAEELDEKSDMRSGDIRVLLSESTGIQTQQTSATSANASIRIQGLDGRYTQILKDGFPLFSGAASGLGLLQTPPLDLKQVEIIKGSASTLYGGGAIAGLVNLISKTPTEEKELRFHLNGSSGKGFDINGFYGQRFSKIGTTIFIAHNRNWAYDPAKIGLSAIPKFERYVFNPKLFLYFNENTKINFGINSAIENRIGGDIDFIEGKANSTNSFFEENKTQRYSTQLTFDQRFSEKSFFTFKNSLSYFNRKIRIPNYAFDGIQMATFSEASYTKANERIEWVMGGNLWTDNFQEKQVDSFPSRNYNQTTFGVFVQNTWKACQWLNLETGFRTDYVLDYGFAFLPRLSALFKITNNFTSRLGGGFGYKSPTIFTEESERIQYRNVLPISQISNLLEKSYGGNLDFNYKTIFGEKVTFSINQLFFYTYLNKPLLLEQQTTGLYQFINSSGHIDSRGTETNVKIGYEDFKLFLGYTYTDAKLHKNGGYFETPLTPKHRINAVLIYEIEHQWRVGLEGYYFSSQKLSDGTKGKDYLLCGFMAERLWEKFSIYLNFENFLDVRQTRFDTIYTGTITNPVFRDIYAPLDGFLVNGGLKVKL